MALQKKVINEIEAEEGPEYVFPMRHPASIMRLQKYDTDTSANKNITNPEYDIFTIKPLLGYAKAQMDYVSGDTNDTKKIENMVWNYLLDEYMRPTFQRHFAGNSRPEEEYSRLMHEPQYDDGLMPTIYAIIDNLNRARSLYNMMPDSLPYASGANIKKYKPTPSGAGFIDDVMPIKPTDWNCYQPPTLQPSSPSLLEIVPIGSRQTKKSDGLIEELNKHFNSLEKGKGLTLEID